MARFRPKQIIILGHLYIVKYCQKPSDVDMNGRDSLWGQVDYWSRTIRIWDDGHRRKNHDVLHTLWHEIIHAIVSELKLNNRRLREDQAVDLLALGIADVLARNGWLTKRRMK
jgi:hypothetical protein